MKISCHICGADSHFLMNKDNFDLFECPTCRLVFVYPQPTAEFLKKEVYSYESGFQSNRVEKLDTVKQKFRYKKVIDYILMYKQSGTVLDVGCGGGHFMYWAKKNGLSPVGVELNKRTADSARDNGFEVFNGFLHDAPYQKHSFDIVFLGELIEHVNSPRELVADVREFLNTDGIMIITTPNINCFWSHVTLGLYKTFRVPWSAATPPYHLFEFNDDNIDMLLQQEGLHCVDEHYLLPPSLKYELGSLHLWKRYKASRKFTDMLFMLFSFSMYIIFYCISVVLHPVRTTDFQMIKIYKKN